MAKVLGMNAKLYYNATSTFGGTGTTGSPQWEEVKAKDVTLNLTKDEADVTERGNNGWNASVATLKSAEITFNMNWDTTRADFDAIQTGYFDDEELELLVLDGAHNTTGSEGLRASCDIMTFTRNEPLREALNVDVTAKPNGSTAPSWYVAP